MLHIRDEPSSSRVVALFADHARSFALPKGATLGDLADRLSHLDRDTPLAINVKLDA